MDKDLKYIRILDKYNLTEMKNNYLTWMNHAETGSIAIGIFGEGQEVVKLLSELLNLPELNSILFPGEFRIRIIYGAELCYYQKENREEQQLSFEEFSEKIQGSDLDIESYVFEGIIAVPDSNIKDVIFTAATIADGFNDELLLQTDISVVALSATHLLSMKEREFIRNPLNTRKCFFLYDLEKVHEKEREQVKALLESYLSENEKYWILPSKEACSAFWMLRKEEADCYEKRVRKIDTYMKPFIEAEIRTALSAADDEESLMRQTMQHLSSAQDELSKYKQRTTRYIFSNYISGIKNNTSSEIFDFYERLNQDITEGVKEERDIKSLQNELPHFITGAWSEFVDNILNSHVQQNVEMVAPAIEEYVNSKVELFLKELLTEEEYQCVNDLVNNIVDSNPVSEGKADVIPGNAVMERKESAAIRRVLPKCLIVLGGIAVLGSSFIPGVLLLAAGLKGNSDAIEEMQEELITAGKKMNYQCLNEVQSNLEQLMERIKIETEITVENCYSEVLSSLVRLAQSYQEEINKMSEKSASIHADLETI